MIRKTSIDVYRQIVAEGLLTKRRLQVYRYLFKHGPLTQHEVTLAVAADNSNTAIRNYAPRFAELERAGAIETVGERGCSVTGNRVLVWDVTDKLPTKLEKNIKVSRRLLEKKMVNYRRILRTLRDDERTPLWAKRVIRQKMVPFYKKDSQVGQANKH